VPPLHSPILILLEIVFPPAKWKIPFSFLFLVVLFVYTSGEDRKIEAPPFFFLPQRILSLSLDAAEGAADVAGERKSSIEKAGQSPFSSR